MSERLVARKPYLSVCAGIALMLVNGLTACSSVSPAAPVVEPSPVTGIVKHVFIIVLENKSFSTTFGSTSPVPYLTQTLASQGAQLSGYYGTGHVSLDNYVSMISGQAGTPQTTSDCQTYADFTATSSTPAANGQILGSGCVYPPSVQTVADQMAVANLTWKGYMGDMGNDPTRESATCGHPTLNTEDHDTGCRAAKHGGAAGRHVCDPPQSVHVLPLHHRFVDMRGSRREYGAEPGQTI